MILFFKITDHRIDCSWGLKVIGLEDNIGNECSLSPVMFAPIDSFIYR